MKIIVFLSLTLVFLGCGVRQDVMSNKFNKKRWLSSSNYRYEIVSHETFPNLEGKTKKYVKRVLGRPNIIQDNRFIYCLDILDTEDSDLPKCKGSSIVIDFDTNPYSVTIINVEPKN